MMIKAMMEMMEDYGGTARDDSYINDGLNTPCQ